MLKVFLLPQAWIFIGLIFLLVCLLKNKLKAAKLVLILILVLYYLMSITPVSYLLTYSLEKFSADYGFKDNDYSQVEAIVVLAGMIYPEEGLRKETELVRETLRRLFYGVRIYRNSQGTIPIIFSGGPEIYFPSPEEGEKIVKNDISVLGVPEKDIIVELRSGNTYESAFETKKILDNKFPSIKNHKIFLVTSALHMLRASKVFEKQGFEVLMVSAGYETGEIAYGLENFIPSIVNFERANNAVYEWMGIIKYKFLNRI